jgi:hypothetical protein
MFIIKRDRIVWRFWISDGMFMMPSTIYWFEQALPNTSGQSMDYKLRLYQEMAKETVTVEEWRREDLEDMLLTLLQDA